MDDKAYKDLLKKLEERMDQVEQLVNDDTNREATLQNVWQIGREVYDLVKETGITIKEVALEIGAAKGTLEKYVRIYKCYPQGCPSEYNGKPVQLSHYIAIIYTNDPKAREFYLREAAIQGWSSQELRRRISANYYEIRQEFGDAKSHSAAKLAVKKQKLYTYAAQVMRVVDGDTFELNIDVGFCTWMQHKVRLCGINCPEAGTVKGEEARKFVMKELNLPATQSPSNPGKSKSLATGAPGNWETRELGHWGTGALGDGGISVVVIRSYKAEKFGRYLVDLWYLPGETNKEVILEKGLLLNQVLLDKGLARKME